MGFKNFVWLHQAVSKTKFLSKSARSIKQKTIIITKWLWIKAKQLPSKFSLIIQSQGYFLTKFLLNVYVVPHKKFSMYISNNLLLFQKRAKFWSNNIQKTSMYIKSCRLEILLYSVTSQVYLIEKKKKKRRKNYQWWKMSGQSLQKECCVSSFARCKKTIFFSNVCITASKLYIPSTINFEKTIFECIFRQPIFTLKAIHKKTTIFTPNGPRLSF